jgi:uncharacterized protein
MSAVRCPVCDKLFDTQQSPAMPFCSQRCRLVDLGRWLDEKNSCPYDANEDADDPEGDS